MEEGEEGRVDGGGDEGTEGEEGRRGNRRTGGEEERRAGQGRGVRRWVQQQDSIHLFSP